MDTDSNPSSADPCPCGSGKKYKKCHGAGLPPGGGADAIGVTANKPKNPRSGSDSALAKPEPESDDATGM